MHSVPLPDSEWLQEIRVKIQDNLRLLMKTAKVRLEYRQLLLERFYFWFDLIFDKYYSFLNNEYMVTVANVVGNSGKIGQYKPHLIEKIVNELLKVENISTTPHLTEECKKVIAEGAIKSFEMFFDNVKNKKAVIEFVKRQNDSSRKSLKTKAEKFLDKYQK